MDLKIQNTCQKALKLCKYMLESTNDEFVRQERIKLRVHMMEENGLESLKDARNVSLYIRDNFDSLVGENVVVEIQHLILDKNIELNI
jgi:hypothetical protein